LLVIQMAHWESDLFGRSHAAEVRTELLRLLEGASDATIDFTGVQSMTLSFADECFGELARRLSLRPVPPQLWFRGTTPSTQACLRFAFRRIQMDEAGIDSSAATWTRLEEAIERYDDVHEWATGLVAHPDDEPDM
jgi:hypothetical protein